MLWAGNSKYGKLVGIRIRGVSLFERCTRTHCETLAYVQTVPMRPTSLRARRPLCAPPFEPDPPPLRVRVPRPPISDYLGRIVLPITRVPTIVAHHLSQTAHVFMEKETQKGATAQKLASRLWVGLDHDPRDGLGSKLCDGRGKPLEIPACTCFQQLPPFNAHTLRQGSSPEIPNPICPQWLTHSHKAHTPQPSVSSRLLKHTPTARLPPSPSSSYQSKRLLLPPLFPPFDAGFVVSYTSFNDQFHETLHTQTRLTTHQKPSHETNIYYQS